MRTPDCASLEQEIAHVRNYMQIMDIRHPGRFHLHVQVSEEDAARQVLSLSLQRLDSLILCAVHTC